MQITAEQAQGLSMVFIGQLEREFEITRKVLAAVPEEQLNFKLGEKGKTAKELMWHLAASECWFGEAIAAADFSLAEEQPPAPATAREIVAFYESKLPEVIEKLKALSGEKLAQTVNFYNVLQLPDVMFLQLCCSHSIHHRGQLSTYLRAMNAHVPSIYGGSADEPFEMPATA